MIKPTVGRVVWYAADPLRLAALSGDRMKQMAIYGEQPMAATVAFVYHDRLVNLSVVDHAGNQFTVGNVPLLQDDDAAPAGKDINHYATWMPYQKGQAARTEKLEQQKGDGT